MVLKRLGLLKDRPDPLVMSTLPDPVCAPHEVLVQISACGVCHTELDEIEGRTPPPRLPVIPGHQVVGRIVDTGESVRALTTGDRVGIGWIYSACGTCEFCQSERENLCGQFMATGRDANGGYAELMTVSEAFAHRIPDEISDAKAAPLLCAGAIGYRSLKLAGIKNGQSLGLTGFGASAHLVLKLTKHLFPQTDIYVFARSENERAFAMDLGAVWAGDTDETPPIALNSIIDTTPVWKPVVSALNHIKSNGRLVINAIRKEDADKSYLLNLDYATHLWQEKEIKSVANVTRKDIGEFLKLAAEIPIQPEVKEFSLSDANQALRELKQRNIKGAKVLTIS
jgi:propanol-preferring alcohol dehydrogenase